MSVAITPDTARLALPLGIHAKYAANQSYQRKSLLASQIEAQRLEARRARFALQETAAHLVPHERVYHCMRTLRKNETHVELLHDPVEGRAHLGCLQTCTSVWLCPVCAARIAEGRRRELADAIAATHDGGGAVVHVTYTVRHGQGDQLAGLVERFGRAYRRLTGHRTYREELRPGYQIFGSVRALEVTSGVNGWHPHYHVLLFLSHELTAAQLAQLERRLLALWEACALKEGLTMTERGVKLNATRGAVGDYVSKFGRDPAGEPWGVESELAKSHVKQGRGSSTPWDLLRLAGDGDDQAGRRWREYAEVFKGRQQLVWSPHLRALLGLADAATDAELAEELPATAEHLLWISLAQWRLILRYRLRAELLAVAAGGDRAIVLAWLAGLVARRRAERVALGIEVLPVPPPVQLPLIA